MEITNVSFDNAGIFKDKMYFYLNGKNCRYARVFDKNGKNILNRLSYNVMKTQKDDYTIITRKKQYEFPNKNIIFEIVERIYDKAGKLIKTEKHTVK